MIDHHEHVCHRMTAAQSTNQGGGKGWDFSAVPAESPTPLSVKLFLAAILVVGVVLFFAPVLMREILS